MKKEYKILLFISVIVFIILTGVNIGLKLLPYGADLLFEKTIGQETIYESQETFRTLRKANNQRYDMFDNTGLTFYSSAEEALEHTDEIVWGDEMHPAIYNYKKDINVIKRFENDNAVVILYTAKVSFDTEIFVTARFNKMDVDGVVKYAYVTATSSEFYNNKNQIVVEPNNPLFKLIRLSGIDIDFFNIDKNYALFDGISKDPKAHGITINGNPPKEIIPFKLANMQYYYWYYDDIDVNTRLNDLNIKSTD